jgi:hypothetical protein
MPASTAAVTGRRRPRRAWSNASRRIARDISNAPPAAVYGLTDNPSRVKQRSQDFTNFFKISMQWAGVLKRATPAITAAIERPVFGWGQMSKEGEIARHRRTLGKRTTQTSTPSLSARVDRVLFIRVPALDQACINAMALGGKLNDFPSPTIRSSENSEICRLSCNLEARLTVKLRNGTPGRFLPSDLPSKPFAWGDRCR